MTPSLGFLLATSLAAGLAQADPSPAPGPRRGARLFQSFEVSGEAFWFLPVGDLADRIDPAPLLGARFATSYYGAWRAVAGLSAGVVEAREEAFPIVLAIAAAGLEWRPGPAYLPKPGLGLSLNYIRARDRDKGEVEYLFMDDGESEFGLQGSLRWSLPLRGRLRVEAGGRWDLMFTEPSLSHGASGLLGAAYAW